MNYLELAGIIVGLIYIWLEYKANIWLWLAGIVMPAIYIFVYYDSGFYADMAINIYYLLAGIYGWVVWRISGNQHDELPITKTPKKYFIPLTLVAAAAFAAIAFVLVHFTPSDVPYGDSFTTALSIVGLWMLARKYVEQWIVWIAVDLVCAVLYFYKGLYMTGALYLLYTVIAVAGYFKWLKLMNHEPETSIHNA